MSAETVSAPLRAQPHFAAVGAGRMGRGIAIAFAYAGHRINLVDLRVRTDAAWQALATEIRDEIQASLRSLVELDALDEALLEPIAARISLIRAPEARPALAEADMVFECVPETLSAKQDAFSVISESCSAQAILTSTTSSILVTDLARLVQRPAQFLNIHWLNPAYLIPVVELSCHPGTAPEVRDRAQSIVLAIGKVPVVCGAAPGYIVPRLQALIMNEAARMVEEGVATAEEIDKATRYGLGLRFAALGVVEFIDYGGCDILYHASRELSHSVDAARYAAPQILGDMMRDHRLGLKTASGFYDYTGRDLVQYRRDALARTLAMTRHAGTFRPASADTLS